MSKHDILFVYVTVPNKQEADEISKSLVNEKLAACVNIIENVDSVYIWNGEVQKNTELVLIAKTHKQKLAQLKNKILQLHSYDCPCIAVFGPKDMHLDFMKWITSELNIDTN